MPQVPRNVGAEVHNFPIPSTAQLVERTLKLALAVQLALLVPEAKHRVDLSAANRAAVPTTKHGVELVTRAFGKPLGVVAIPVRLLFGAFHDS
jgi:hypothetical protein